MKNKIVMTLWHSLFLKLLFQENWGVLGVSVIIYKTGYVITGHEKYIESQGVLFMSGKVIKSKKYSGNLCYIFWNIISLEKILKKFWKTLKQNTS